MLISKELNATLPECSFSSKQCRTRYQYVLDDSVNPNPITPEEEVIIDNAIREHGKRWTIIAKLLDRRTDNQVKNFYHSRHRRHCGPAWLGVNSSLR